MESGCTLALIFLGPWLNSGAQRHVPVRRVSARDIQVFVGGALALSGFYSLIRVPFYVFSLTHDMALLHCLFNSIIAGLSLALGIANLVGNPRALRLTKICLWLEVVAYVIFVPVYYGVFPSPSSHLVESLAPTWIVCVALLWLTSWSQSQRFQVETKV
jgi:hypothetical protein